MKAQLLINLLKSSLEFSGKKGIRYYLNGVHFSYDNDQHQLKIQATDGHAIIRHFTRFDNTFISKEGDGFILSNDDCKTLCTALKAFNNHDIKLDFNSDIGAGGTLYIGIGDNDKQFTFFGIDSRYPDTNRVMLSEGSIEPTKEVGLDFTLLGKVGKSLKHLKLKRQQAKMSLFGATGGIQFERDCEVEDEQIKVDGRVMPCRL